MKILEKECISKLNLENDSIYPGYLPEVVGNAVLIADAYEVKIGLKS